MGIDLSTLSARELNTLIKDARKQAALLKRRKPIAQVRRKVEAAARASGYTIAEVFGVAAPNQKVKPKSPLAGAKVRPKYRNPARKTETWSGRGSKPRWLTEALKTRGAKLEHFLIKAER